MEKIAGDNFQFETKYTRNKRLSGGLDWANKPEIYKNYPSSKIVELSNNFHDSTSAFLKFFKDEKASAPSQLHL